MNDILRSVGRALWILAGIAILIGAIFGIAFFAQQLPPSVGFIIPHASCNFAVSDGTANYSATIIDQQNYDATVTSVMKLITKYSGDFTGQNVYDQQYPNDASGTSYVNIHATNIYGTIPLGKSESFMSDVAALAPSSSSLNSVSYSKTIGDQMNQSCADYANNIKSSEALTKLYFQEMPLYLKANNTDDASSANNYLNTNYSNNGYGYPNSGTTNIDDFNNQIQNSYSNISSNNDSIAQLYQSLNKTSVSVTIQDKAQPSFPPTFEQPTYNGSPTPPAVYPSSYDQSVNSSPTSLPTNYQ